MAKLIGMRQICNHTNRSESTVLNWIRDMDFPATKIGGIYEADSAKIDEWRDHFIHQIPQKVDPAAKKKKIETLV